MFAGSPSGRCAHSRPSCAQSHVSAGFEHAPPGPVAYRVRIWLPDGSEPPGGEKVKTHEAKNNQYLITHLSAYISAVTINIPNLVQSKSSLAAHT